MLIRVVCFTLLVICADAGSSSVHAVELGLAAADTDAARAHFDVGRTHYEAGAWQAALDEFQRAQQLLPSPSFDYNIARCHDRLEHWHAAADGYERYLRAEPKDPNAGEIRARIQILRERGSGQSRGEGGVVDDARGTGQSPIAAGAVAGGAVLLAGVGAGLLGHVAADLSGRAPGCCAQSTADALKKEAYAGYAALGVAGALTVVDVVLWLRWSKSRRAVGR